jgi:hypothetical protein
MCPPEFTLLERWGCDLIEEGRKTDAEIPGEMENVVLGSLFVALVKNMPEERSEGFDEYVQKMMDQLKEFDMQDKHISALAAYLQENPDEHDGHVVYALLALEYGKDAAMGMVPRMEEVKHCAKSMFHVL